MHITVKVALLVSALIACFGGCASTAKTTKATAERALQLTEKALVSTEQAIVSMKQGYAAAQQSLKENLPSVFDRPGPPSGKGQVVCGVLSYLDDNQNIYPDAAFAQSKAKGFGILTGRIERETLLDHHGKYLCVTGEIIYRGCGADYVCEASGFLHAVRVDEISS